MELGVIAAELADAARRLHQRGFMLATSGNLSAVVSREPLRLAISSSGKDKGSLKPEDFLVVNEHGQTAGAGKPSDELPLHLELADKAKAGAVVHTHSIWGTLLSDRHATDGGLTIQGFEMLKALSGVKTHEHREWIPIIENSQDYGVLRAQVKKTLAAHPASHGILLAGHGLYSWGKDVSEAVRHAEGLEFLLEVKGRKEQAEGR
jgi:methylthioribulose-1-phosphate dehydratase